MKLWIPIYFVILLFRVPDIPAVEVDGLYEIELVAESRSDQHRKAAMKRALSTVLGRVLVGDDVMHSPIVTGVVDAAPHYVSEFQFALSQQQDLINPHARLLRIVFDEQRLMDLFRANDIGVWSEVRPRTLVWLVIDADGSRQFYSQDEMPAIDLAITRAAEIKALPIIFPILDLTERQVITPYEILSAESQKLIAASERYDVVSILAGRLVDTGLCWQSEWALHFDGGVTQWEQSCTGLDEATLAGMQGVYAVLSKYYGVKSRGEELKTIDLRVRDIANMEEIVAISDFLTGLERVKDVRWQQYEGQQMLFSITYSGDQFSLVAALSRNSALIPEPGKAFDKKTLHYRYRELRGGSEVSPLTE